MIPFAAILAIVALGQTLVIQQGGIDLSVPGIVSLSGVIVSYYSSNEPGMGGSTLGSAIVYAIARRCSRVSSTACWSADARVAPIVATLGMNAVLYGVDVEISGGTPVQVPESLSQFVDFKIFGVSTLAYIAVGITIVWSPSWSRRPCSAARFEAVGANPRAARAAGVVAGRYQLAAYAGASGLYCLAGIFLAGLMQLPSAFQGDSYLMPSIAAVVLGGTSLFGGIGNLAASVYRRAVSDPIAAARADDGSSVGVQFLFQGGAIIVGVGVYSVKWKSSTGLLACFAGEHGAERLPAATAYVTASCGTSVAPESMSE